MAKQKVTKSKKVVVSKGATKSDKMRQFIEKNAGKFENVSQCWKAFEKAAKTTTPYSRFYSLYKAR